MTKTGKRLISNFSPKINKSGLIFSSIVANDKGNAVLEKMFIEGDKVMKEFAGASDVYEMKGDTLDMAMKVLSPFERFYNETDESFIKRNKAIFIRNGNTTWGTKWDVMKVFEFCFPTAKVHVLENIGKWQNNLLINSSFESQIQTEIDAWQYLNCEVNGTGCFSGEKGVIFTESGSVSQSAEIEKGIYFVTFAAIGKTNVEIIGSDGISKKLYFMGEKITEGEGHSRVFQSDEWKFNQVFFISDKNETVTVKVGGEPGAKVDLVTLDKKTVYPRFTVYVWFDEIEVGESTLHLSQNGDDPIPGVNYDKESYFDRSFFIGSTGKTFADDIYNEILNVVKAAGTKGEIAILTKEGENGRARV